MAASFLHFETEQYLEKCFNEMYNHQPGAYRTTDLYSEADLKIDIEDPSLPDESIALPPLSRPDIMKKQVDKSHYSFSEYMNKQRWISVYHQIHEVSTLAPKTVLEIGPGPGLFKAVAKTHGFEVRTLDIDPELLPDVIASATSIPLADRTIDVACAFQVLEHMPFEVGMRALEEMCRVADKAVIVSLPDARRCWPWSLTVPWLGEIRLLVPRPFYSYREHIFDGQHYWEVNKKGYELHRIIEAISRTSSCFSLRTYRVHENPYHRFFILHREAQTRAEPPHRP